MVLCEDGSGREYLHGLTPDGEIFRFAENNIVLPQEFQTTKGYSGNFSDSEGRCHLRAQERQLAVRRTSSPPASPSPSPVPGAAAPW